VRGAKGNPPRAAQTTARRPAHLASLAALLALGLAFASPSPAQAASLARRGEVKTGPIKKVAITNLTGSGPSRVVTAVRQGDDDLKLIVWDVTSGGELTRRGDALAGQVSDVDVTALSTSRVVTAVRDGDGDLKVILFDVSDAGALVRRGSAGGGPISAVALQSLGATSFVTAVRGGGNKLKVIRWAVGSGGTVSRDGEAEAGEIGVVDSAGSPSFVTAVSDGDGELKLIHWWQGGSSGLFRGGSGTGGGIATVRIAGSGGLGGRWFTASVSPGPTAVRTGSLGGGRLLVGAGTLKVIEWELAGSSLPSNFQRRGEGEVTGTAGISFDLALTQADPGNLFVTATAGVGTYRKLLAKDRGKPHLKLIVWKPNSDSIVKKAEATQGGEYRSLSIATIRNPQGNLHRMVTAVRGAHDELKLTVWDYLP
jgi:hypothetical protein